MSNDNTQLRMGWTIGPGQRGVYGSIPLVFARRSMPSTGLTLDEARTFFHLISSSHGLELSDTFWRIHYQWWIRQITWAWVFSRIACQTLPMITFFHDNDLVHHKILYLPWTVLCLTMQKLSMAFNFSVRAPVLIGGTAMIQAPII